MTKIESPSFGRAEFPHTDGASAAVPKRKRGRPPKVYNSPDTARPVVKVKRGGRPVGSRNKPKPVRSVVWTHPIIESLKAEIAEAVELQRAHFPNDDELTLRNRAEQFRWQRYRDGRWPKFAAVAKQEAAEKAAVAAAAAARAAEAQNLEKGERHEQN
jgi:hypothetical protein